MLFLVVQLRIGFEFAGILTIFGNPILSLFWRDNVSLITYVKQIF
jgi:hypothetical protein